MKIIAISILMLGILISMSFSIDLFLGFEIKTSLRNALSPFRVKEIPEYLVFMFLISAYIIKTLYSRIKNRVQKKRSHAKG